MYMYICIYVYMFIYVYVYVYIHIYIYYILFICKHICILSSVFLNFWTSREVLGFFMQRFRIFPDATANISGTSFPDKTPEYAESRVEILLE